MKYSSESQQDLFRLQGVLVRDLFSVEPMSIPCESITVLQGPSGCGKTTFLRLLNRMTPVEEGEISYKGRPLKERDPVQLRREVVMLAQRPVLFTERLRDELLAGCLLADRPLPDDGTLKRALKAVNLEKSLTDDPRRFSGGEQQRLALARIALMDASAVLLDEPSAGLDSSTEEVIFSILSQWAASGKTVILATHARDLSSLGVVQTRIFRQGVVS
ncbi:ABC transporter ATP-binding protein [Alkalispirochaeta americana]|nr:ABC transporter ATP-binding protein [Alkalispirochaeta americana]